MGQNCPSLKTLCRFCHKAKHSGCRGYKCDEQIESDRIRQELKCPNKGCTQLNRCSECRCSICRSNWHKTPKHNCSICRRYGVTHIEKDCKMRCDDIDCCRCHKDAKKNISIFQCKHMICLDCLPEMRNEKKIFDGDKNVVLRCPTCDATSR